MSNQISMSMLKDYMADKLGITKLSKHEAQDYDIKNNQFEELDSSEDNYLDIYEILEDDNLYSQFATMYVEDKENDVEADPEKEKEKANQIQNKGQSKA